MYPMQQHQQPTSCLPCTSGGRAALNPTDTPAEESRLGVTPSHSLLTKLLGVSRLAISSATLTPSTYTSTCATQSQPALSPRKRTSQQQASCTPVIPSGAAQVKMHRPGQRGGHLEGLGGGDVAHAGPAADLPRLHPVQLAQQALVAAGHDGEVLRHPQPHQRRAHPRIRPDAVEHHLVRRPAPLVQGCARLGTGQSVCLYRWIPYQCRACGWHCTHHGCQQEEPSWCTHD